MAELIAGDNLKINNSVIADMVNPTDTTRNSWNKIADTYDALLWNIEILCSDPLEHKKRLETRTTTVPGLIYTTWTEIMNRGYEPWNTERISLETSGKTLDSSFEELISALQEKQI